MKQTREDSQRDLFLCHFTVDNISESFVLIDNTAHILRANKSAAKLLEYTHSELLALKIHDIAPEYDEKMWPAFWKKLKVEKSFIIETHHLTKNGRIIPCEISANYINFEDTEFSCFIIRDISDRIHALKEKEKNLKAQEYAEFTIEHVGTGIFWHDAYGRFFRVNHAACEMLGYSREELLKLSVYDVDVPTTQEHWHQTWQLLKEKRTVRFTTFARKKDGSVFPVENIVNYMAFEGSESGCALVRDITQTAKRQERIRDLARFPLESPNPVFRFNREGKLLFDNHKISCVAAAWNNKPEQLAHHKNLREDWIKIIHTSLNTGKKHYVELDCCGQTYAFTFTPIVKSDYVNVYGHDITLRKIVEEEVAKIAKFPEEYPSPVLRIAHDGKILYDNKKSKCVTNTLRKENSCFVDEKFIKLVQSTLLNKQSRQINMECGENTFSLTFAPIIEYNYVNIYGYDITARILAEKKLQSTLEELEKLKNKLQIENTYLRQEIRLEHNFSEIISVSKELNHVLRKIEQVASTDATVLILGETGTGKELLARAIHNISPRRERPLIKVNCAVLPEKLIESELFGHEKGAFTGAVQCKIGRFELADGGTIFLDEIGELPLALQAKLLRVLQDGEFERLGNSRTMKVDVRVIAATNRDLAKEIKDGNFRQDLYYRLNVFPINVPPLRERKKDIPLLVNHFVNKYSKKFGRTIKSIPSEIIKALEAYSWPGNIRELENIIERGVIISADEGLVIDDASIMVISNGSSQPKPEESLDELESSHILQVLKESNWIVQGEKGAAKRLGIAPSTLRDRMRKYSIVKPN